MIYYGYNLNSKLIQDIRNVIFDNIDLQYCFSSELLEHKPDTINEANQYIKNYLYSQINKNKIYNQVNKWLLQQFPIDNNTRYYFHNITDKNNIIAINTDKYILALFSTLDTFNQVIWPDSYIKNILKQYFSFCKTYKDIITIMNIKRYRNCILQYIRNIVSTTAPKIIVDNMLKNNLSEEDSITNVRTDLFKLLKGLLERVFIQDRLDMYLTNSANKTIICLKLTDTDIDKLTQALLNNKSIFKEIQALTETITTDNEFLIDQLEKEKNDKIGIKDLAIGESRKIDGNYFWWDQSHDLSYIPIVYINGNVIIGNSNVVSSDWGHGRVHHNELVYNYFHDMSLHKNDIIILDASEWEKLDAYDYDEVRKYHAVRAVMKHDIITLIDGGEYRDEAVNAFINKLSSCQVLALSDDMTEITRKASFSKLLLNNSNKFNRLYKKLYKPTEDNINLCLLN